MYDSVDITIVDEDKIKKKEQNWYEMKRNSMDNMVDM